MKLPVAVVDSTIVNYWVVAKMKHRNQTTNCCRHAE